MSSLPRDLIIKFLEEQGATRPCSACGHNQWGLPDKEEQFSAQLMIPVKGGGFVVPPPHIPLIILLCGKCGQIRIFAKGVIINWAEKEGLLPTEKSDG